MAFVALALAELPLVAILVASLPGVVGADEETQGPESAGAVGAFLHAEQQSEAGMILYGRNLSPFARRIAIWCALQGREIERRDILVTGDDFKRLATMNPVARVPVLELDDGSKNILLMDRKFP